MLRGVPFRTVPFLGEVMKKIRLMEVCGTHTMAIARSGIKRLLPEEVELISGPGCPVCVTPQSAIDKAVNVARIKDVIIVTFGDMLRVPGTEMSLDEARRRGADVRVVYSSLDAISIAEKSPEKRIVFMGVGFETTTPTVASVILGLRKRGIHNLFLLSNFKVLFPALSVIASSKRIRIDGFICPGHVSVITGTEPYRRFATRFKKPCVITGFEDADIIKGISRLVTLIKNNLLDKVEIEYKRAVRPSGNRRARDVIKKVFTCCDSEWRGLGLIKKSGLKLKKEYKPFDADAQFDINVPRPKAHKGCLCGEVLQGIRSPRDCRFFKKSCTPRRPIGPCMVSSEGTCAACYKYGD